MRILIIDNNIDRSCWGSADLRRFGKLVPDCTLFVRRAPHDDLPASPESYDRIIVSGSKTSAMEDAPWIDRLHDFIRRSIDLKKPYLGVCFGHQALVRTLGGKSAVKKAAQPEFGWTEIKLIEESELMKGFPGNFHSFSSHFDEISRLPSGMKLLARSEACEIQACQLEGFPVFGIQFHPEKNLEEANQVFLERRKRGMPKALLKPRQGPRLYDPKIGEKLFLNFFTL